MDNMYPWRSDREHLDQPLLIVFILFGINGNFSLAGCHLFISLIFFALWNHLLCKAFMKLCPKIWPTPDISEFHEFTLTYN